MPSTRRQFLDTAAILGTTGFAGCVGSESPYSPGTDEETEWPMPAYDQGFSAYVPDAAAPRTGVSVRWSMEIPGRPVGRPVVAGGTVFLSTAAGLTAFDLEDGTEQWHVGEDHPWPSPPVVHDGVVYVGFDDQPGPPLRALDAGDGGEVWTYETRGDVRTPAVLDVDDGTIHGLYVGDDTGRVYKFDPASGDAVLHTDVFGAVSRLAFAGGIVVGTEGGELYSFYDDGNRLQGLWRRKLPGAVTAIASSDGGLYVATFGGPLYRLSDGAHAGNSRWTAEGGATHLAATPYDAVGSDLGGLGLYHYRTGEQRWGVDGRYGASPAVAGDLLVAGGGERGEGGSGFVAGYDVRGGLAGGLGGRSRWTFETESAVMEGITVADGAVFAATQGIGAPPRLYVLDPA